MPDFERDILSPKLVPVQINLGPEAELEFVVDVHRITPRWFDEMTREEDTLTISRALAEVIPSWNLTAGDQPVPPDVETLARFPMDILTAMMQKIGELPTRAEGEASSGLSQPQSPGSTPTQQTHQNGAATSDLPKSSESLSTA